MSLLDQVQEGITPVGLRVVIAGLEKMGKTTFAAGAPDALYIPCEVGYAGVAVKKTPMVKSLQEFQTLLNDITTRAQQGQFPFRSIIIDSWTAIERFIHEQIISEDPLAVRGGKNTITMDSCHGGYGKGYNIANERFEAILKQLDDLAVYAGINIIGTCHTFASQVIDPTAGEYNSWDLLLHSPKNMKTYGKRELLTQWADVIGFLYEPVFLSTATTGAKMTTAVSQGQGRKLAMQRTPSYVAGNRFGIQGELTMPTPQPDAPAVPKDNWNVFAGALHKVSGIDVWNRS